MRQHYGATGPEVDWSPSWNVCPTRQIPVLLGDRSSRRLGLMRWGWNPPALGGRLLINCRGEEAHAKRMFQEPLARRRCLILATAFYEWRPPATKKERAQPFAFVPREAGLFAIGGLWEATGGVGSVILMTVPANEVVAPVHDRMPLVIGMEGIGAWLNAGTEQDAIQASIVPSGGGEWQSWPVGRGISDVKRDGAEVFNQVQEER